MAKEIVKKSKTHQPTTGQPMSIRLPDDLRAELTKASEALGESETTVARMSIRHGLKALLMSFERAEPTA
jgi:hypothetical protein